VRGGFGRGLDRSAPRLRRACPAQGVVGRAAKQLRPVGLAEGRHDAAHDHHLVGSTGSETASRGKVDRCAATCARPPTSHPPPAERGGGGVLVEQASPITRSHGGTARRSAPPMPMAPVRGRARRTRSSAARMAASLAPGS
jgi:hypothetical protein